MTQQKNKMVNILMYHSIGESAPKEAGAQVYCVSTKKFREQMGYVVTTYQRSHLPKEERPLVTFDDGLEDNYTNAYPVLKEFGLKAYFFILAGCVGTSGYMSWRQICELRDAGMIIGSHGMTHRILTELNDAELDYELRESKKILEERLGQVVDCFSIPRGFYNKKVMEAVKRAGYTRVFTSNPKDGKMGQTQRTLSLVLPTMGRECSYFGRIAVKADWDLEYFKRVMEKGLPFKAKAQTMIKNASKKLLGAKNYDRFRMKLLKE